jgi:hypothetical protein
VGGAIDPINLAIKGAKPVLKGVGHGASGVSAFLTGSGKKLFEVAARTGAEGGEAARQFRLAGRSQIPWQTVVNESKLAVRKIREIRAKSYKGDMKKVAESTTPIPFDVVNAAFREVADRGVFKGATGTSKGQVIRPSTEGVINEIANLLDDWRQLDPSEFHTPIGMDQLKQSIGDIRQATEAGSASRTVADQVYHAIKDAIIKEAPDYGKIMSDYENLSDLIRDLEHSFKIGEKAKADSTVRALMNSLKQQDMGHRAQLLNELEKAGATHLLPHLAGGGLSTPYPRGIQGVGVGLGTLAGLGGVFSGTLPLSTLAVLPLTSPRLMGGMAHHGGRVAGLGKKVADTRLAKILAGQKLGAVEMGRLERDLREKGLLN